MEKQNTYKKSGFHNKAKIRRDATMNTKQDEAIMDPINERDFFDSKKEYTEYLIMKCLIDRKEPSGSWILKSMLQDMGVNIGTATIGRILKDLDSKEYTKPVSNKGRILTTKGSEYIEKKLIDLKRAHLNNNVMEAAQSNNLSELVDLLSTRAMLECEAAKQAALRASEEDIRLIEKALNDHQKCVAEKKDPTITSLEFHKVMAKASHNKLLTAILNLLIFEETKLESKIGKLVTRELGPQYVLEHEDIVKSVKNKDAKLAEKQMRQHMLNIINAIEKQKDEKYI